MYKFRLVTRRSLGPATIYELINTAQNRTELRHLFDNITNRDRRKINMQTRTQSESALWFEHRKGCITGTIANRIVNNKDKNSESLNRAITKFNISSKSYIPAINFGKLHESDGINTLWNEFKNSHRNAKIIKVGLCLDPEQPYIAGSPDIMLSCENCCNEGQKLAIGEIKCPYRLRNSGISEWRQLEYLTDTGELKQNHPYYYQQNLYCGITKVANCFFHVWTPSGQMTINVPFDDKLFQLIKKKAELYYFKYYLSNFYDM